MIASPSWIFISSPGIDYVDDVAFGQRSLSFICAIVHPRFSTPVCPSFREYKNKAGAKEVDIDWVSQPDVNRR